MGRSKVKPIAYHPLLDGVDAAKEVASRPRRVRPSDYQSAIIDDRLITKTDKPAFGPKDSPPDLAPISARLASERTAAEPAEPDVAPGPPTLMLFLTQDLRSITFTGAANLYPAVLSADWCRIAFGLPEGSPLAVPMHRLTPTLWRRVEKQVRDLWDAARRELNPDRMFALIDNMQPILDYVTIMKWEPNPCGMLASGAGA